MKYLNMTTKWNERFSSLDNVIKGKLMIGEKWKEEIEERGIFISQGRK